MDLSWGALSHGLVSWHWHSCKTSSSQPCALRFSFPRAAGWDAPGGRAWPGRGLGTSVLWAGWRWASGGSGSRGTVTGLVTAHSRVGHTCPAPSQVRVCTSHSQRRPQGLRHWGVGALAWKTGLGLCLGLGSPVREGWHSPLLSCMRFLSSPAAPCAWQTAHPPFPTQGDLGTLLGHGRGSSKLHFGGVPLAAK